MSKDTKITFNEDTLFDNTDKTITYLRSLPYDDVKKLLQNMSFIALRFLTVFLKIKINENRSETITEILYRLGFDKNFHSMMASFEKDMFAKPEAVVRSLREMDSDKSITIVQNLSFKGFKFLFILVGLPNFTKKEFDTNRHNLISKIIKTDITF